MPIPLRLLILEDNPSDAELILHELRRAGFEPDWRRVETEGDFVAALDLAPDLILADYKLPQFDGLRALDLLVDRPLDIPFILVSGTIGEERAVEAMKKGAADYLLKDRLARLGQVVANALEGKRLRDERRRAEEALKNSEKRLSALIENGLDNISLLAVDGTLLWESPATFRTLGYAPNEFLGRNIFALMHPDDLAWTRNLYEKVIQRPGSQQRGAFRLRHSDGTWRWAEAVATNLLDEPSVQAIVINYRDITERKQAEEALRESEERYRRLVETLPDGVVVHSQGRVVFANPAGAAIIGAASPADLTGKPVMEFVHPDYRELALKRIQQSLNEGVPVSYAEEKFVRLDGTPIDVEVAASPFSYAGKPAMLTVFNDITGRVLAERRYRDLFEEAPVMYVLTRDRGGVPIVADCNQAFLGALGYSRAEVVEQTLADFYTPASRARLEGGGYRRALDGQFVAEERSLVARDGRVIETLLRTRPEFDAAGKVIGTRAAYVDVTERRQAEEALRESNAFNAMLLQTIPFGMDIVGEGGQTLFLSPAMEKAVGQNALGARCWELYKDDKQQCAGCPLRRTIEVGVTKILETSGVLGGRTFEINHIGIIFRGKNAILEIFHDITERKRAEEEIRRMALMLDTAPNSITVHDFDGRFVYANQRTFDLHGFTQDEFLALNVHQLDVPDSENLIAPRLQVLLDRGEATFQVAHYRKDGPTLPLEVSTRVTTWGDKKVILSIATDITARKRAEEELQKLSQKGEGALRIARMGHWEFDLSTAQFAFNDQYYSLHGTTAKEAGGYLMSAEKFASRYVHPDAAYLVGEAIQQAIETNDPNFQLQTEARILRADGEPRDVTVWFRVEKDPQGRTTKLIGVNQDVTERKRAEQDLRQRLAELEALHNVSAALRTAQTRDEALPILLDETLAVMDADGGIIWLYYPDSDELRAASVRGWFRQLSETPMKPGEGIAGTVFASGQTHVSPEFHSDPMAHALLREQSPPGWGGACVPIRVGAVTIGVLFVSVPLSRQIATEQVQLLESLAEMAGAALHRMRLHEETARQLDQLQALHNIDLAITASVDLRMTLNFLLEHVLTQLKVDAASVLLLNPQLQTLEFAAGRGFRTDALKRTSMRLGEGYAGRAALERKLAHIPDLRGRKTDFLRSALISAEGFVAYYGIPLIAKGQVKGVLEVFHRAPLDGDSAWLNFLETLAGQAAVAVENGQLFDHLQRSNIDLALAYEATIEGWSHALDLRDKETEGHTQRVTEMTLRLARQMGIDDAELVHIRRGALLHDIGKMGVPDSILLKPGPLTEEEWAIMHQHPTHAFEMLAPIDYLRRALDIPYCHHEKWDGAGYPRGLKGERIPLAARIFAVVDVWDALRSVRPYRAGWPEEQVREYIREQAGKHFDPAVAEVFLRELTQ